MYRENTTITRQQRPGFLRMPAFTCGACGHPQRGGSRYKVTADNLGGVRALMTASGRAGLAALLAVGMVLCTISRSVKIAGHPAMVPACVSEADKAALKDSLVGRQVSRLLPDAPPTTGAAGTAGDQPPPQNSRGVAYRPKGTLFRTARAPCCPVKERGRRRDLSPRGARAGPSWWHARRASHHGSSAYARRLLRWGRCTFHLNRRAHQRAGTPWPAMVHLSGACRFAAAVHLNQHRAQVCAAG